METFNYNKKFIRCFRSYLRECFSDVYTTYRYRYYKSSGGKIQTRIRGAVLNAKGENCSLRFEVWGDTNLVESTFIFGKGNNQKFFRSYSEIESGNYGNITEEEVRFINKILEKSAISGNNALDFILGSEDV